jgi:hypothetical protein
MKVIELDQRTGEEISVAEFEGEKALEKAQEELRDLRQKANNRGRDYLKYWISD